VGGNEIVKSCEPNSLITMIPDDQEPRRQCCDFPSDEKCERILHRIDNQEGYLNGRKQRKVRPYMSATIDAFSQVTDCVHRPQQRQWHGKRQKERTKSIESKFDALYGIRPLHVTGQLFATKQDRYRLR